MLKQNSNIFNTLVVLSDLTALYLSFFAAGFFIFGHAYTGMLEFKSAAVIAAILFALFIIVERNELSQTYRFKPYFKIMTNILMFDGIALSLFFTATLFNLVEIREKQIVFFLGMMNCFFLVERVSIKILLSIIRRRGFNFKRYLVVGAGRLGLGFYRKIAPSHELGIKIVGFLDDNEALLATDNPEYTDTIKGLILGKLDKMETVLQTLLIDNVIVTLPMDAEDKIIRITNLCEKYGIKAELIPDYYRIITSRPSVRIIKDYPLIGIRNVPLENMFNRLLKRIADLVLSFAAVVILMPLMLVIMLLIKLTSPGPVFFRQKRTGYRQKDFYILKFRTMRVNEESDKVQATKDDPRKTPFGDFLRRTNLDELPQLFNILFGDMSIVGPRPHMILHTEEFYQKYDKYLVRHWVKPGLTGWAQVNGWRGDSDIAMRVRYDIEYIENWSLLFDLKVVFLTVFGRKVRNNAV